MKDCSLGFDLIFTLIFRESDMIFSAKKRKHAIGKDINSFRSKNREGVLGGRQRETRKGGRRETKSVCVCVRERGPLVDNENDWCVGF